MSNIKVEVTNSGPCERTLSVQVDSGEFRSEREKVLRQFRKEARIPGFRPGKVPVSLIESRFKDSIRDEAVQNVINNGFRQALEQEKINPLTHPVVEKVDLAEDMSVSFEARVEVYPEVKLEKYTGFVVEKKLRKVDGQDIDQALENVREQQAHFVPKEGKAEKGEYLLMDFRVLDEDGEPDRETERKDQLVMAGHEDPNALFSHALVGLEPGGDQELTVDFPADYPEDSLKGRTVRYRLDVKDVRQRVLPELDDEFARGVSHAGDLNALRELVRGNMEQDIEHRASQQVEEELFRKVIDANEFELPNSLIEESINNRVEYVRRQNRGSRIDEAELKQAVRPGAILGLKREFVIHEIARKEDIQVTPEDVSSRIEMYASQLGQPLEEVQKDFRSARSMNRLRSMILEDKVVDFLKRNNEIKEVETKE